LVASGGNGIVDEGELSLYLCELVSKASAVIVISVVSLNLGSSVPIVEVRYCLA